MCKQITWAWSWTRNTILSISLEPVFFLFMVNHGLTMISNQDLYLSKACQVNLNFSSEICNDRSQNDTNSSVILDTQRFVSEIQAYNGLLQSAPAIIFTIFAGPLSDSYGRKPLIIFALFGYLVLDIIFLINSYWFYELRVEYLLFECLQDFTGGAICFYLASYSYIVDTVHPFNRTWRMSILDSFMPLGFLVGLPLGTFLKNHYGNTALYFTGVVIIVINIIYVLFVVRENKTRRRETYDQYSPRQTNSSLTPDCLNPGFWILETALSGLKTILKSRPNKTRVWVINFVLVFSLSKGIESGWDTVQYMFYILQYRIENTDMSTLMSVGVPLLLVAQLGVIPFLSKVCKFRDTSILILAVTLGITASLVLAFNTKMWALYLALVFGILGNTITTTSRSNLSKLMEEHEIGKAFSVLGILQALLPVLSKPTFALLYKNTLSVFPATCVLVRAGLSSVILAILILTHIGLKRREGTVMKEAEQLPEMEHLKRESLNL